MRDKKELIMEYKEFSDFIIKRESELLNQINNLEDKISLLNNEVLSLDKMIKYCIDHGSLDGYEE